MRYVIRLVAPAEWRKIREMRLAALQDPISAVAFARSHAEESALPEEAWRQRASGAGSQQFAAIRVPDDGSEEWVGMAVVLVERADYFSVNAVYLRPEARGTGVAEQLFAAVTAWTWDRADRLYLRVHERNPRAEAFYRRLGFVRTGESVPFPPEPSEVEYELVLTRG